MLHATEPPGQGKRSEIFNSHTPISILSLNVWLVTFTSSVVFTFHTLNNVLTSLFFILANFILSILYCVSTDGLIPILPCISLIFYHLRAYQLQCYFNTVKVILSCNIYLVFLLSKMDSKR